MAGPPPISPDGRSYWDGSAWRSLISADGSKRWNGTAWMPIEADAAAAAPAVATTAAEVATPAAAKEDRPSWLPAEVPMPTIPSRSATAIDATPSFVTVDAPLPQRAPTPAASRLPIGAVLSGGLALVAVVAVVAYSAGAFSFLGQANPAASGTGNQAPATATTVPSPTPTPETDATRAAMAQSLVLTEGDVGPIWTFLGVQPTTPDQLTQNGCMADFPAYQAGVQAQYAYLADGSGHDSGWMSSTGRVVADDKTAAAMQQRVASGGDDSCLAQTFQSQVASCGCMGGAVSVGTPSLSHPAQQFSSNGTAINGAEIKATVPFQSAQGPATMYIDYFRLTNGRRVANLAFFAPQRPVAQVQIESLRDAAEGHLVSNP